MLRFSGSVFHCIATAGCIAGLQLTGVQGMLDALLLPAEKLLQAVGMGRAEGASVVPHGQGHFWQAGTLPKQLSGALGLDEGS